MYDLKWMYKAIIIVTLQLLQLKIIIVPALVFHGIACCVAIPACLSADTRLSTVCRGNRKSTWHAQTWHDHAKIQRMLSEALFSPSQARVLAWLFGQPERWFQRDPLRPGLYPSNLR